MIPALLLALCLTQPKPSDIPSGFEDRYIPGACEFRQPCAATGACSLISKTGYCIVASDYECAHSNHCQMNGSCLYSPGYPCIFGGDDPCGPESVACRVEGFCKAAPDPRNKAFTICRPTREGCKNSINCRLKGECTMGRGPRNTMDVCIPNARSCRESLNCKRLGDCRLARNGTCEPTQASCAASEGCRDYGDCQVSAGNLLCGMYASEDCARSRYCSVFGRCARGLEPSSLGPYDLGTCAALIPQHCAQSVLCQRYGACTPYKNGCFVSVEFDSCELERVPIKKITASSERAPWDEYTFEAQHLVDHVAVTVWQPAVEGPGPHAITFEFEGPTRVAGLDIANGFHHFSTRWGQLLSEYSSVRGLAVLIPGGSGKAASLPGMTVHEALMNSEDQGLYQQRIRPVTTDRLTVELFDRYRGTLWDYVTLSELAPLRCKSAP